MIFLAALGLLILVFAMIPLIVERVVRHILERIIGRP